MPDTEWGERDKKRKKVYCLDIQAELRKCFFEFSTAKMFKKHHIAVVAIGKCFTLQQSECLNTRLAGPFVFIVRPFVSFRPFFYI